MLDPNNTIKFVRFVITSIDLCLYLPIDKVTKLTALLKQCILKKNCTIREFSQLIGYTSIISVCTTFTYGWCYTKRFEKAKFNALLRSSGNYDAVFEIPGYVQPDLRWWITNVVEW